MVLDTNVMQTLINLHTHYLPGVKLEKSHPILLLTTITNSLVVVNAADYSNHDVCLSSEI